MLTHPSSRIRKICKNQTPCSGFCGLVSLFHVFRIHFSFNVSVEAERTNWNSFEIKPKETKLIVAKDRSVAARMIILMAPPTKKTKTKKPLNAYNLLYKVERQRILRGYSFQTIYNIIIICLVCLIQMITFPQMRGWTQRSFPAKRRQPRNSLLAKKRRVTTHFLARCRPSLSQQHPTKKMRLL